MTGDIVDELARVLDPHAFASWEGMVAHCLRAGDSQEDAERWATMTYGPNMEAATKTADAALSWFRGYLGSDEVVERAADAFAVDWGRECADEIVGARSGVRAALSAAIGEPSSA